MSKNYIGFVTIENWLNAIDPAAPVQASCIVDPGHFDKRGLARHKQVIVVSQTRSSDVLYCRVPVDAYISQNSHPMFDQAKHQRIAESAWEIVREWLAGQNLNVQFAVVAMPRNLKLLDGDANFLRYDPNQEIWTRALILQGAL